jgi:cell division protein FtsB
VKKIALTIFSFIKNKYTLAVAAFLFLLFFYDRNNIFVQLDRRKELSNLEKSKNFYQTQNNEIQKQLLELENNPNAAEKYAREHLYMKRDNEDVFIVDSSTDSPK